MITAYHLTSGKADTVRNTQTSKYNTAVLNGFVSKLTLFYLGQLLITLMISGKNKRFFEGFEINLNHANLMGLVYTLHRPQKNLI